MISQSNTINLGELERTLESYLQNQMRFTDIESISLTLLEGDSKENRNFTSTSVRFSAVAFFRSAPPLESEVRAEQGFLLMAIPELQIEISSNQALQGVSVADVSFEKIDTVSPMDEGDTSSSTNRRELGILLGAFSATVVAIASALLIVRFRRMARKQRYNLTSKTIPEPPPSITEVKQDYYEEEEAAVHVKPGCQSLCSGDVSLGDGDLSTYMMTASPKTYNIHAKDDGNNIKAGSSSTANNSSTDMHHKPPTEEISIRQSDVFDYDDNYLTTDETSVAL